MGLASLPRGNSAKVSFSFSHCTVNVMNGGWVPVEARREDWEALRAWLEEPLEIAPEAGPGGRWVGVRILQAVSRTLDRQSR